MTETQPSEFYDVLIVGAGFAGLHMLHLARERGWRAIVIEAGDDVGGTWYWNRYPGLRCDVESVQYAYAFSDEIAQKWDWTERYSPQREIQRYLAFVADQLDMRRDIRFGTRIARAAWDEDARHWTLTSEDGETFAARFAVMATGAISKIQYPAIDGVNDFAGETYHTAAWPAEPVSVAGKRVAVIGTGSSGIQLIPELARDAGRLYVLQRTAPYVFEARNRPLADIDRDDWKASHRDRRGTARHEPAGVWYARLLNQAALETDSAVREAELEQCWNIGGTIILSTFNDIMLTREANDVVADFVRRKIAEIIDDPALAAKLTPTFPLGAKRPPIGTNYYETFNRDNVELVDLRETPIVRVRPEGIETSAETIDLDVLVYATGYDALTGALSQIEIRGSDGTLKEKWADGPRAHLGIMSRGFPNMFFVTGPGSPSVLTNVVVAIEQHVEWIASCIAWLEAQGVDRIEPEQKAEDDWVQHVDDVGNMTVFPLVDSWYLGSNVPGKPRRFMPYAGGLGEYRKVADAVAADGYRGFALN